MVNPHELRIVDPREIAHWDDLLLGHPGATIFHTTAWCSVLCGTYGYTPLYLADVDQNQLRAALPLLEVDSWLTGRRGICLPFTDECGPLAAPGIAAEPLVQRALALGPERRWKYLEIRELPPGSPAGASSLQFHAHTLDLRPSEQQLLAGCESSVRRALRKSEAAGLALERGDSLEAMRDYCRLHRLTRQRHGLPPQPFAFFRHIWRHIIAPGRGSIFLARQGGRAVAGAVFFHFGSRALYKFGASDEAFQSLRPNNLVLWSAICHYRQQRFESLSFGRTSAGNAGLRRFKLGWGCTEHTAGYFKHSFSSNAPVADRDHASGRHNALFRALPRWLSRAAGKLLYRHIA